MSLLWWWSALFVAAAATRVEGRRGTVFAVVDQETTAEKKNGQIVTAYPHPGALARGVGASETREKNLIPPTPFAPDAVGELGDVPANGAQRQPKDRLRQRRAVDLDGRRARGRNEVLRWRLWTERLMYGQEFIGSGG